jgi:hypothetical protein
MEDCKMNKLVLLGLLASAIIGMNTLHARNLEKTMVQAQPKSSYDVSDSSISKKSDSLCLKVHTLESFRIKGFRFTNLDGLTIITADSITSMQNMLAIAVCVKNVAVKNYSEKDTFGFHLILTTGTDTVLNRIIYTKGFDIAPNDTDGFVNDSSSILYRYLKKGTYSCYASVIYTSRDGYFCDSIVELSSKTVTFYVDTKAPVRETLAESTMNVFPNPASEQLNITCGEEMRSIALFNTAGQRVRQMEPCGSEAQIPLSGLPRGLYLLRVQTANGSAVRKVVVE